MKFRKKSVVIEAFQMIIGTVSCEDFPISTGKDRLVISTLKGTFYVEWNDRLFKV